MKSIQLSALIVGLILMGFLPNNFILAKTTYSARSISRSQSGLVPTEITFVNQRNTPVKLFWLNYTGKKILYATIPPEESFSQSTYVTHPWLVTTTDNKTIGVYYPDGQPRTVDIQ